MNTAAFLFAVVVGMLLAETRLSRRHEAILRGRGAMVPSGDPYVALAVLYPLAFLAMGIEGVWRAIREGSPLDAGTGPAWAISGILLFVASKALKYWAIGTLGERWSFRVIVLPGLPLVHSGPYRYIAHPNYVAVVGELIATAMMMRARVTGPLMTAAFGAALLVRLRFETRVHRAYGLTASRSAPASEKIGR